MFLSNQLLLARIRDKAGISLLEVVVALALVGIIAAGFLSALATTSTGRAIADEQAASRMLAESVMEDIKKQGFASSYNATASVLEEYPGYTVTANATTLGTGKQKVTVTVSHRGRAIHILEGYKVER